LPHLSGGIRSKRSGGSNSPVSGSIIENTGGKESEGSGQISFGKSIGRVISGS